MVLFVSNICRWNHRPKQKINWGAYVRKFDIERFDMNPF